MCIIEFKLVHSVRDQLFCHPKVNVFCLYMPPPQSQLHGLESHPLPDFQSRPAGAGSHNAVSPPESTLDRLTHFNLTRIFG